MGALNNYVILFIFIYVTNKNVMCFSAYSTTEKLASVNFEELLKLKDDPNYLLIDVREPSELEKDGSIPGSINIPQNIFKRLKFKERTFPVNNIEEVLLSITPDEFKEIYGRDKPDKNSNIIFSCRSGRRSADAQEKVIALGFKKAINYSGGWLDWEAQIKGI